jgi:hypothetical protein
MRCSPLLSLVAMTTCHSKCNPSTRGKSVLSTQLKSLRDSRDEGDDVAQLFANTSYSETHWTPTPWRRSSKRKLVRRARPKRRIVTDAGAVG